MTSDSLKKPCALLQSTDQLQEEEIETYATTELQHLIADISTSYNISSQ